MKTKKETKVWGAYTRAKTAITHIKELNSLTAKNLKQLFLVGDTLDEDAELIADLKLIGDKMVEVRKILYAVNHKSADMLERYVEARKERAKDKEYMPRRYGRMDWPLDPI